MVFRQNRLAHLFLALTLLAGTAFQTACTSGMKANSEPPRVAMTQQLKERLGADDGYALSIMYGADLGGNLNDCGCHAHPMGGLAWRMGYAEGFRSLHRDVPALQLDAGHLFSNSMNGDKFFPDALESNKWMLKGYHDAGFTAANIAYQDLPYITEMFKKDGYENRVKESPFIKRLVSANVKPTGADQLAPIPFLVEEIPARGGKTIRVGITGVTSVQASVPGYGYEMTDPIEAARKAVSDMRGKADLVVVMAYTMPDVVEKIAQIPGIDLLIGAQNGMNGGGDLKAIGKTPVVYTYSQTKFVGDARLYLTPDGKVKEFKNHFAMLDQDVPKDPKFESLVAEAKTAIETAQRAQMAAQAAPQVFSAPQVDLSTPVKK